MTGSRSNTTMRCCSCDGGWFSNVEAAPPIEVFQLTRDYQADTHPQKVRL